MKPLILIFFSFLFLKSFGQHFIQNYDGKIAKGRIVNINGGWIVFADSNFKSKTGIVDTFYLNMINISKFGINPDFKNTTSKSFLTNNDLYNLSYKDAINMERRAQKLFTSTAFLGTLSITGFVVATLFNEPIKPNKSDYYYTNTVGSFYDITKYRSDSSNYFKNLDAYLIKTNVTRIVSGILGAATVICATSGVNNLLRSKRNKHLADQISIMFSPTNLYFGYKF